MDGAKALQFYYTSCQTGLSGYAGYQTHAASTDLHSSGELQELEGKALYERPREDPNAEGITEFPTAFRTFKLSSGRMALIHSVYTGKDYSGREGNYFAHGLVLDQLSRNRWPIDSYSWRGWVKGLENDRDSAEPEALPTVAVAELTTGLDFEFDELKAFLGKEESREDTLEKMLTAVFNRKTDVRNIVIRDNRGRNVFYWIACIQKAFPPAFQQELSCSTFQFDPRNTFAVNATVDGTNFLFDHGEVNYQFYVFDFIKNQQSPVESEHGEYTKTIATWMRNDTNKLRQFHQFSRIFDCCDINEELISILRLYRLEQGEDISLSPVEFQHILAFINTHAHPSERMRMLNSLKKARQGLHKATSLEDRLLAIKSLEQLATLRNDEHDWEELGIAWTKVFDDLVFKEQKDESAVLSLQAEIEGRSETAGHEIAQAFLSNRHLDSMLTNLKNLPAKSLGIIASQMDHSYRLQRLIPTYDHQGIENLIESVLSRRTGSAEDLYYLLDVYKDDSLALVSLVDRTISISETLEDNSELATDSLKTVSHNLGKALSDILIAAAQSSTGKSLRIEVLSSLVLNDRFLDVILSEWQSSLPHTKDVSKAYAYYDDNILRGNNSATNVARERIAVTLLTMLDTEKEPQLAREWVESGRCRKFSAGFANKVFNLASQDITLLPEDKQSAQIADKVSLEADDLKVAVPDRVLLRKLVQSTLDRDISKARLGERITDLDKTAYNEYLGVVLPVMMNDSATIDAHREMLHALNPNTKMFSLFKERYISVLQDNYFNKPNESCVATVGFWIKFDNNDKDWMIFRGMKRNVEEALITTLSKARKKNRFKIANSLKKSSEMLNHEDKLNAVVGQIEMEANEHKASRSFFARIFRKG